MSPNWGRYTHCGDPCATLTWEEMYGTTAVGNLPQHKKHEHIGNMFMPCPYSTQAIADFSNWPEKYGVTIQEYEATFGPVDRYDRIKHMLGLPIDTSDSDIDAMLVDHSIEVPTATGTITKEVYMRPTKRAAWGYECIFPGCPYYIDNGRRYFYA